MLVAGSYQSSTYISASAAGAGHASGPAAVRAHEIGNGRAANESVGRTDAERAPKVRAIAHGAADHGERSTSELIGESATTRATPAAAQQATAVDDVNSVRLRAERCAAATAASDQRSHAH